MSTPTSQAVSLALGLMRAGAGAKQRRTHNPDDRVAGFALNYLDAFGYLRDELKQWSDVSLVDIVDAIGRLQSMFGLKRTKTLDVQTVRAMEAPRCGCSDGSLRDDKGLKLLVASLIPEWKARGITYRVVLSPPDVSTKEMETIVGLAFHKWTMFCNVTAVRALDGTAADVMFTAAAGHQSNFDGPGGALVTVEALHDVRRIVVAFDADETWAVHPSQRGIQIDAVACHAVGHVLGLDHTDAQDALMTPYYNALVNSPQLSDDLHRLKELFGRKPA